MKKALLLKLISMTLFFGMFSPVYAAQDIDCVNFANEYNSSLEEYLQNGSLDIDQQRKLEKLKQRANKQSRKCIKRINREFKDEIKRIKELYPRDPNSKEVNLSNKSKKDAEIAQITLERDRKMQALPKVLEFPLRKN
jgi:hypothetical protein